jgi:hypothetical protein
MFPEPSRATGAKSRGPKTPKRRFISAMRATRAGQSTTPDTKKISTEPVWWGGPPGPQPAPRPASCLQNQKLRNEPTPSGIFPSNGPQLHSVQPRVFKHIPGNWVCFAPGTDSITARKA